MFSYLQGVGGEGGTSRHPYVQLCSSPSEGIADGWSFVGCPRGACCFVSGAHAPWPATLRGVPTARCRDNFFVGFPTVPTQEHLALLANSLTGMLCMPVKLEGSGLERRMLEVRVRVRDGVVHSRWLSAMMQTVKGNWGRCFLQLQYQTPAPGNSVRAFFQPQPLAYVNTIHWNALLRPSWRRAVQFFFIFLRRQHYPVRWWLRPFALAATRHGTKVGLLPRCLRLALSTNAAPRANYRKQSTKVSQVSLH